jgi:hypothetical protein
MTPTSGHLQSKSRLRVRNFLETVTAAAVIKYYLGKTALELLCAIYGLNIALDITGTA